jgi:uncharacterized membrane protein YkvA (DUF1232 family)
MAWLDALRARARALKQETHALYFAARDARTPWFAKLLVAAIVGYALSPIDLVPDFIPVLGVLDDLLLLPLGIAWAIRMVPPQVLAESRERARLAGAVPGSRRAAVVIVLLWLVASGALIYLGYRAFA